MKKQFSKGENLMTTERVNKRIEEIENVKPNWDNKQVVIQAIGEIIEENDSFVESFLLCKNIEDNHIGALWIDEDIDYIPPKTLEILGKNGMGIEKRNSTYISQITFY